MDSTIDLASGDSVILDGECAIKNCASTENIQGINNDLKINTLENDSTAGIQIQVDNIGKHGIQNVQDNNLNKYSKVFHSNLAHYLEQSKKQDPVNVPNNDLKKQKLLAPIDIKLHNDESKKPNLLLPITINEPNDEWNISKLPMHRTIDVPSGESNIPKPLSPRSINVPNDVSNKLMPLSSRIMDMPSDESKTSKALSPRTLDEPDEDSKKPKPLSPKTLNEANDDSKNPKHLSPRTPNEPNDYSKKQKPLSPRIINVPNDSRKPKPLSPRTINVPDDSKKVKPLSRSTINVDNDSKNPKPLSPRTINVPSVSKKHDLLTPDAIALNELMLKTRIKSCKDTIEMLKQELHDEKSKLAVEVKKHNEESAKIASPPSTVSDQILDTGSAFGISVAKKLGYDSNLMDYEQQLQKYQTTLTLAQIEKKKAVRKEMMAKAFELKLLEVENQCNIELLRVKQNLQFLQPLRITVNQWQSNKENSDKHVYEFPSLDLGLTQINMRAFTDNAADQGRDLDMFDKSECQSTSSRSSSNII